MQGLCSLTPLKPVSGDVQCRQPCSAGLRIKTPPGTGTAPPPRAARPSAWPPSVRKFFPISNRNLPWCNLRPLEVIQKSKHQGAERLRSVHQKLFPPVGLLRRSCLHVVIVSSGLNPGTMRAMPTCPRSQFLLQGLCSAPVVPAAPRGGVLSLPVPGQKGQWLRESYQDNEPLCCWSGRLL